MSATLYLLRQQPDDISLALFQVRDVNIDVVFIERATSIASSFVEGAVIDDEKMVILSPRQALTYDDLVEKIFSSEHVIVL
ncbi:MAG: hypothetical protein ABIO96_03260 [Nitrospiraceae bacterium]